MKIQELRSYPLSKWNKSALPLSLLLYHRTFTTKSTQRQRTETRTRGNQTDHASFWTLIYHYHNIV